MIALALHLLINERRPALRSQWSDALRGVTSVRLISVHLQELMAMPEVDAIVMMGMFAHERYGGMPVPGRSQILDTGGDARVPPWVVSTAPLAASARPVPVDTTRIEIVPQRPLEPEQQEYLGFREVFGRILEFNEGGTEDRIGTLAVDCEFIRFPLREEQPRGEMEALLKAYHEYWP